jgi:hypothetical protein
VWSAGLAVVVAAGAATAHGLYEVALGSGTPAQIAWLYPVLCDGLALVAYAATSRLVGSGRRYAWAVVVLAAGLSGLAQATYLAGGVGVAPAGLRFGVGAWPAVAAAIAAHLLYLIGTHPTLTLTPAGPTPASEVGSSPSSHAAVAHTATSPALGRPDRTVPTGVPAVPTGVPPVVSHAGTPVGTHPRWDAPAVAEGPPSGDRPGEHGTPEGPDGTPDPGPGPGPAPAERARALAARHADATGELPTVRELAELAEVGRGTASRALAALRAPHPPPAPGANGHLVPRAAPNQPNDTPEHDEKDTQR